MNFTFGIVTDGVNTGRIHRIIDTIESTMGQNCNDLVTNPDYEIIIVGGGSIDRKNTNLLQFNECNQAKISGKKNLITDNSKFDNIVYLHDYIEFDIDWYRNFLLFGDNFNICINPIINLDGTRYRDWCLWMDDADKYVESNNYLIPYDMIHLTGMMYISGAYWVGKKKFMLENRLNENLEWGQGEDVEWSIRSRESTAFSINEKSRVKLMKYKDRIFNEVSQKEITNLSLIKEYKDPESYNNLIKNHLYKWIN
jgi:hypothetical protein